VKRSFVRRRAPLLLLTLACLLAACSGRGASPGIDPAGDPESFFPRPPARYPAAWYLSAWGISATSFSEAESDARARVAEQVASDIEAEIGSEMESISRDGELRETQRLYSRVTTRSRFDRAELIRIDAKLAREHEGRFYAFAYLSREELGAALTDEYEASARSFRAAAAALPGLREDVAAYTAALRRAQASYPALADLAAELRVAAGRPYEPFLEDRDDYLALEADRAELLASLSVGLRLDLDPAAPDGGSGIRQALKGALAQLGLRAQPDGCDAASFLLRVSDEADCGQGPFGPRCTLRLRGELAPCPSGPLLVELDLAPEGLQGSDRRDPAEALRRAYLAAEVEALLPVLKTGLAPILPIAAPEP
jgi:hypothetical protein